MAYNEALAKRIRAGLKGLRGMEEKKMFGGVGFLIHGNLACGVHRQDMVVRLSEGDYEAALKSPGIRVFDITGRPMRGWILVSAGACDTDRSLKKWLDKSVQFAKSLPPK
jgi:TfoX/Sxy family transcriptional regulator of competence genes